MPEAVIVAAARTPIGRAYKGGLKDMRPDELAAHAVRAAVDQVPQLDPSSVRDLMLGCGAPGGEQGFNMGRVVSTLLGWDSVPGTTVTRYCASSVQTTRMAMHAIRAGEGDVFIAAGVETISRGRRGHADTPPVADDADPRDRAANPWTNPRFAPAQSRTRERSAGQAAEWTDPRSAGELPDVYIAMGQTAENVAQMCRVSREEQDEFALRSQELYQQSLASGFWKREITPLTLPDGTVLDHDESPRAGTTLEKLAALAPVFRPDGTVTAGNACPLNDGAAALVVMSDRKAAELGITPLARVVATGVSALSPEIMGLGPIEATRDALANTGLGIADIDLFEINEAFAAQVIPSYKELGIPLDKLNVNGGGIAAGHPFGMTGARIATTLLNSMATHDKQFGLETMCIGGGQGMAMILERLS
ncbi:MULTISPECIES: acetyl-CoA C-acetyltransferase [Rhodococcus]|uniref:Acetyl-CoA C-acetyltransferase n=1 Tax=Rhodococcus oxybenzonivorans TaxID=1990687 RepID=A0AAE5A6B8_9NOCA|nr:MULTISPECIES: acetyl-CoA C-acetyltransferase [Rhodococcus]MDV7241869.1 acetyl-CoA C-acetyltransferase [Rhodococcus oxybenzonivorans]MDV7265477.1 acetyl-CoA C-acetyltransferase [Rhodococcus oxybenzonivorans]MDV7273597.1 acetyl-CoA C-acetyltransferase [Rhodococcus oxybenzonivorans]MDV7334151.1 acetyl-CoA C-acetyltransferase [Rhodococcus oxybenzonivorans]MDV7343570.1 acetyl-CoA C-acetyltransferase [Rhodococcus oxybenzonivorans]